MFFIFNNSYFLTLLYDQNIKYNIFIKTKKLKKNQITIKID